jgi:hypothetical protein
LTPILFNGFFDTAISVEGTQSATITAIVILLNNQATKDEILRLYNVSHGTSKFLKKETINYTIDNLDGFKNALKRCSVLPTSHSPGNKLQFIFSFSIAASTNVSAFTQKVGFEFSMIN